MRKGVHWNMSATYFTTALLLFLSIFFLLGECILLIFSSTLGLAMKTGLFCIFIEACFVFQINNFPSWSSAAVCVANVTWIDERVEAILMKFHSWAYNWLMRHIKMLAWLIIMLSCGVCRPRRRWQGALAHLTRTPQQCWETWRAYVINSCMKVENNDYES